MNMMSGRPLPVSAIEQVVNEVLIRELARIIHEAEGSLARTRDEAQAVLERMERSKAEVKDEAARRDYARAEAPAAEATLALGYSASADADVRQRLYARSFAAVRQVNTFEKRLEKGDTVEESAERAGIWKSRMKVRSFPAWVRFSRDSVWTAWRPSSFLSTYIPTSFGWSNPVWYFSATTRMLMPGPANLSGSWVAEKPLMPASVYSTLSMVFSPEKATMARTSA